MRKKKTTLVKDYNWQLPSNHQNILFMLANGLITGPDGFEYEGESRYYKDILVLFQGLIPLFRHSIPDDIRSVALEESPSLIPAIVILNMKEYTGDVYVFTGGEWEWCPYAEIATETYLIAVPAPLPTAWITSIAFNTEKDMDLFRSAADDIGNVDIAGLLLVSSEVPADTRPSLMEQKVLKPYMIAPTSETAERGSRAPLLEKAQALGGIVAILYHLADRSDLGAEIFKKTREALLASESCGAEGVRGTDDIIMKAIPHWIAGKNMLDTDWRLTFFFGLLEHIIQSRKLYGPKGITSAAHEYIIAQLNSPGGLQQSWPKGQKQMAELATPTLSPSKLFEEFKGTISHALLLFFQRERCEDLLEFQTKNPSVILSDADTIAAVLLFGAREGWSGLPKEYRCGLSRWISSLMAVKAHSPENAAIGFGDGGLQALRELFAGDAWSANEKRAVEVARNHKWMECLFTKVKLPPSYAVEKGCIILPGDTAAKVVVEKDKFLSRLQAASFDEKEIIRKALGLVQ